MIRTFGSWLRSAKSSCEATFGDIKKSTEPARDQFIPWLADLKDLQKYLSNDLTIGGIDAVKDLIAKTKAEGRAVQQSLDKVIAELNTVVATIRRPRKSKASVAKPTPPDSQWP